MTGVTTLCSVRYYHLVHPVVPMRGMHQRQARHHLCLRACKLGTGRAPNLPFNTRPANVLKLKPQHC
jgi:hypothetical protein